MLLNVNNLLKILDENVRVDLPNKKEKISNIHLLIRRGRDATKSSNLNPRHGPSIKVYNNSNNVVIILPPHLVDNGKDYQQFLTSIYSLSKYKEFRDYRTQIHSAILDNYMLLLAYWFTDIDTTQYLENMRDHIITKLSDPKYIKMKPKIKSKEEYEKDKVAITQYIKDILQDDNVLVKFN